LGLNSALTGARNPCRFEGAGWYPHLPPGGIGNALTLRVRLGDLDKRLLQLVDVLFCLDIFESRLGIQPFLAEIQLLERVFLGGEFLVDGFDALADAVGGDRASGTARAESLQIGLYCPRLTS